MNRNEAAGPLPQHSSTAPHAVNFQSHSHSGKTPNPGGGSGTGSGSGNLSSQTSLFAKSSDDIVDPEAAGFEAVGMTQSNRPAFPPSASLWMQAEQRRQTKLEEQQIKELQQSFDEQNDDHDDDDDSDDMLAAAIRANNGETPKRRRPRRRGRVGKPKQEQQQHQQQRQPKMNNSRHSKWDDNDDSDSDSSVLSRTQSQLMSVRTLKRVKDNASPSASSVVAQSLEQLSDESLDRLEHGIPCKKVTSRGTLKPRTLTVSQDHCALFVTHQPFRGKRQHQRQQQQQQLRQSSRPHPRYKSSSSGSRQKQRQQQRQQQRGNGIMSTMANKVTHIPLCSFQHGFRGYFIWRPSKHQVSIRDKYVRYIDVADLCGWHVGVVGSARLELARRKNPSIAGSGSGGSNGNGGSSRIDDQMERIVTILYKQQQTLDVLVAKPKDRQALIDSLRQMRATYHASKVWVTNEALLLRYIWYDIDLDRDGGIGLREFKVLLSRINLQVPHVEKEFHNYLKEVSTVLNDPEREFFRLSMRPVPSSMTKKRKSKKVESLSYEEVLTLMQRLKNKIGAKTPVIGKEETNNNENHGCIANQIWNDIFGATTDVVTVQQFCQDFLHGQQKMIYVSESHAQELLATLAKMESNHVAEDRLMALIPTASQEQRLLGLQLTRSQFEIYLFDTLNSAYDPLALNGTAVLDDSNDATAPAATAHTTSHGHYPLSAYWINTSHNTYLTGDQLKSNSSVSMYLSALRRGCKCLELDCWDGERHATTGQPIPVIYHGHTLTSKILFVDVIRCIKSYLLSNPDTYPIILSLENHCSLEYQETMASNLKEILGDALYYPENHIQQDHHQRALPSPEDLIGKVVLKGKRPPEKDEDDDTSKSTSSRTTKSMMTPISMDIDSNMESTVEDEQDPYDMPAPSSSTNRNPTSPATAATTSAKKPATPKILPELARLTLFHGTKYKSFGKSMVEPTSHMHSVGETRFAKIVAKKPENSNLWRKYNAYHMTRVYPKGSRVDSSNFNPCLGWAAGAQLVALNFQTVDPALVINDGRFRENRRCGYVLKPQGILPEVPSLALPDGNAQMSGIIGISVETEPVTGREEETASSAGEAITPAPSADETDDHGAAYSVDDDPSKYEYDIPSAEIATNGANQQTNDPEQDTPNAEMAIESNQTSPGTKVGTEARDAVSDLGGFVRKLSLEHPMEDVMEEVPSGGESDWRRIYMTNHVNPMTLRIRVLAGSCLPKPLGEKTGETIDPYVTVTLHDIKSTTGGSSRKMTSSGTGKMTYVSSSFETKAVDNNGYCPIWKEGREFKDLQVLSPQVAMLQFTLNEKDVGFDDRVAEAAIPCSRLRQGYRSVQLFDLHNTRTGPYGFATLLVDIDIRQ